MIVAEWKKHFIFEIPINDGMLKQLSISNYALISHLDIHFSDGLSIMTGETGAGKSIILGALALILGQRADTAMLKDKNNKCIVEGVFDISNYSIQSFFEEQDIDFEKQTIVRREIQPSGKTRAFINDTPVQLNQLKELGLLLVDIHSQHEALSLNSKAYQLSIVDAFACHQKLVADYKEGFKQFQETEKTLKKLLENEKKSKQDKDYYQFQWDELDSANLIADEQKQLEEELQALQHTEEIKTQLFTATHLLTNEESNTVNQLNEIKSVISKISRFHSDLTMLYERLNSCYLELSDIANEMEILQEKITYQPERMEVIHERLNIIYTLLHKHRVQNTEQLMAIKEDLNERLQNISSLEDRIIVVQQQLAEQKKKLNSKAQQLSDGRKNSINAFEKQIQELLLQLGMPNTQIKVEYKLLTELTDYGQDDIQFMFSANKGTTLQPIHKVASGGELSRLMLSIKSLIAELTTLPTLIFDEIDAGVSGNIAYKVGALMQKIATSMQVIAITHLPQIASKGKEHYKIYKTTEGQNTVTEIKKLTDRERIDEIAEMLSGKGVTKAAKENAIELLRM